MASWAPRRLPTRGWPRPWSCAGLQGCKRECANQVDMAAIKIEWQAQRNAALASAAATSCLPACRALLASAAVAGALIGWRNRSPCWRNWASAGWGGRLAPAAANRWRGRICCQRLRPSRASAVFLLVDTFAGLFQPHIAMAAQAVLHAAGYQVHVLRPLADDAEPARPLCCGRTYLSWARWTPRAKKPAGCIAALAPALASGAPIVGLEPSCIPSLRDDHLKLGLGEDARQVARQVSV